MKGAASDPYHCLLRCSACSGLRSVDLDPQKWPLAHLWGILLKDGGQVGEGGSKVRKYRSFIIVDL
jgi:hypothetical protein